MASALLEAGAVRDALTLQGETPLKLAERQGHEQTEALLRSWKPSGFQDAQSPQRKSSGNIAAQTASTALPEDMGVMFALLIAAVVPLAISRMCSCISPRPRHT